MSPLPIDEKDLAILRDLLASYKNRDALPRLRDFRVKHESARARIDRLLTEHYIASVTADRIGLTFRGLRACDSDDARKLFERANEMLAPLKGAYRENPGRFWEASELAARFGMSTQEVRRVLTVFAVEGFLNLQFDPSGFVSGVAPIEQVLDTSAIPWAGEAAASQTRARLSKLVIQGYRPFRDFKADLGQLTVVIGANAAGKSAMFGALRLLAVVAQNPLPPEIDPFLTPGASLFHVGQKPRMLLGVSTMVPDGIGLEYELELVGPVGEPRVKRELLVTAVPIDDNGERFKLLDFELGRGSVQDPSAPSLRKASWSLEPNAVALRRALDPTLSTLSGFHKFVSSWRLYSGFNVGADAPMRSPSPSQEYPVLLDSGDNLSAVLHDIVLRHPAAKAEIENHLASAIPGFRAINVKPVGKGHALGAWQEQGVKGELTLADLSDGTLRLLAWLTLLFSPNVPPLLCIDEPELGLHPRALPVLASAMRLASTKAQLIVSTHSPHFLAQFALEDIAVMRKENGGAVFVRPASSGALKAEVDELGGEAIARLFVSDELEGRS